MGRHRERHQLAVRPRWAAGALAALLVVALLALGAGDGGDDAGPSEGDGAGALGELVSDEAPGVVSSALSSAEARGYESDRTLVEEGEAVLEGYRSRGDCVLAQAGYLDLMGRTWGCVTQGAGWVEVCIVREASDGGGCSVATWRMDSEDVDAG